LIYIDFVIDGGTSYRPALPGTSGVVGDVKATLAALLPLPISKKKRNSLMAAQRKMQEWNALLARVAATERAPLRPRLVLRALSDRLARDAVISLDVDNGGFSQLMAGLATAVKYELPVKIIVLKNNSLAEVLFEQAGLGNPPFGCDLSPIDFAGFANNCGADGFRCTTPSEVRSAIRDTLQSARAAVLEAVVDANEKPALTDESQV